MKVLIPYDGTRYADNALLELGAAGLGSNDEIVVVITDVWLPESLDEVLQARSERRMNLERSGTSSYAPARRRLEEERLLSLQICKRLSLRFPMWNIRIETLNGSSLVSSEILEKIARWKPDLIILGSQSGIAETSNNSHRSDLWRVVSKAKCSVRLARTQNYHEFVSTEDPVNQTIAILTGSTVDPTFIRSVARRLWPVGSEVCLFTVLRYDLSKKKDSSSQATTIEHFKWKMPRFINASPPAKGDLDLNWGTRLLESSDLLVSTRIIEATAPLELIVQKISDLKPDCLFVADGENSFVNQIASGSDLTQSSARSLLSRSSYSLEIVRTVETVEKNDVLIERQTGLSAEHAWDNLKLSATASH
ncbi:MAG: universal stress protein [Acidobacteriota bacterium]